MYAIVDVYLPHGLNRKVCQTKTNRMFNASILVMWIWTKKEIQKAVKNVKKQVPVGFIYGCV